MEEKKCAKYILFFILFFIYYILIIFCLGLHEDPSFSLEHKPIEDRERRGDSCRD